MQSEICSANLTCKKSIPIDFSKSTVLVSVSIVSLVLLVSSLVIEVRSMGLGLVVVCLKAFTTQSNICSLALSLLPSIYDSYSNSRCLKKQKYLARQGF